MRRMAPFAVALLALAGSTALSVPPPASAQWTATLGIYDDPGMSRDHGTMDGPFKEVFVGIRFDVPPGDITGLEFSVAGLEPFVYVMLDWMQPAPTVVLGTIATPADTLNGRGGLNAAWSTCQVGDRVVLKLVLFAVTPPQNHVLQVRRRYPPSNPQWSYPLAVTCDVPCYGCHYRLRGPVYWLNPTVGVEPRTWGGIKRLYGATAVH